MFESMEFKTDPSFCYEASPAYCDERAVEVPWTLEVIRKFREGSPSPVRLCDVGCHDSRHLVPLSGEGIILEGIDIQPCSSGDLITHNCDIRDFKNFGRYDVVTCISTLEHIGFEVYGGRRSEDWFCEQVKSAGIMKKMLNANGILILTLPLGRYEIFPTHVNYDLPLFYRLKDEAELKVMKMEMYHFDGMDKEWRKSNAPNTKGYGEGVRFATGVLLAVLG